MKFDTPESRALGAVPIQGIGLGVGGGNGGRLLLGGLRGPKWPGRPWANPQLENEKFCDGERHGPSTELHCHSHYTPLTRTHRSVCGSGCWTHSQKGRTAGCHRGALSLQRPQRTPDGRARPPARVLALPPAHLQGQRQENVTGLTKRVSKCTVILSVGHIGPQGQKLPCCLVPLTVLWNHTWQCLGLIVTLFSK